MARAHARHRLALLSALLFGIVRRWPRCCWRHNRRCSRTPLSRLGSDSSLLLASEEALGALGSTRQSPGSPSGLVGASPPVGARADAAHGRMARTAIDGLLCSISKACSPRYLSVVFHENVDRRIFIVAATGRRAAFPDASSPRTSWARS